MKRNFEQTIKEIIESIKEQPASIGEISIQLKINHYKVRDILVSLRKAGYVSKHGTQYSITEKCRMLINLGG